MDITNYKLLDVKKTSSVDNPSQLDVIITYSRRVNNKVKSARITPDMGQYKKLMSTINDFQNGDCTTQTLENVAIRAALSDTTEEIDDVAKASKVLSAHLSIRDGHLFVDDNVVNRALEKHVLSIMHEHDEGKASEDSWVSLVHFVEKLYANQSDFVRNQFYGWLDYQTSHGKITLTREGNLIAYKGVDVYTDDKGQRHARSIHAGHGFVNGVEYNNANLPNDKGDIVEMPREEVNADPNQGCHIGLHVGTWDYANDFGDGNTLIVEVDPADIVSVPNDCNFQKIRVSKYKVINVALKQLDETVFTASAKPDETSIPDFYDYMEYDTGNRMLTFVKEKLDFDYDTENSSSICAYDADTDHYYKFNKDDMTFRDETGHIVEQNDFAPETSSYNAPSYNDDKLENFVIPEHYAVLHYVSERGNEHAWDKDDIEIIDNNYYDMTIYSESDEHYFTLHKEMITFLDDDGDVIDTSEPETSENDVDDETDTDDENDNVSDEQSLEIPHLYTYVLYVTKDGEPREYFYQDIISVKANNDSWTYTLHLVNGDYRTLDADRVFFIEPDDEITLENYDLKPIKLPDGTVLNDIVFAVNTAPDTTAFITTNADTIELPFAFNMYVNE